MTSQLRSAAGEIINSAGAPSINDRRVLLQSFGPSADKDSGGGSGCVRLVYPPSSSSTAPPPPYSQMIAYRVPTSNGETSELVDLDDVSIYLTSVNRSGDVSSTGKLYADRNRQLADVFLPSDDVIGRRMSTDATATSGGTLRRMVATVFPASKPLTSSSVVGDVNSGHVQCAYRLS